MKVSRKRTKVGSSEGNKPVHARLPRSVVKAVSDVQDHWSAVATIRPVIVVAIVITSVLSLECVAAAPDCERQDKHHAPGNFGARSPPDIWKVECESEHARTQDLSQPV
jgi:hypothetical protein